MRRAIRFSSIENVTGSDNDDRLTGSAGVNRLDGGAGNDTIAGGAGADDLVGGLGTDTADYSASLSAVTVNLSSGTGTGGDAQGDTLSGIENLLGSVADDILTGDGGVNVLDGGSGNDTLSGMAGDDSLVGGLGNDVLAGGLGADALDGGAGNDTADYTASSAAVTVNLATNTATGGDAQGDTFTSIENLTGSTFADLLTGDAGGQHPQWWRWRRHACGRARC